MKHSIRQHVLNAQGLKTTKIIKVDGELGSSILDKNNVEIFEGDKLRIYYAPDKYRVESVRFLDGKFDLLPSQQLLADQLSAEMEVVGHWKD